MKRRTSWARRMRALTAAAWASAGLAHYAGATISFIPNTPDSTLRVTHTADLSIGAAGTSFKDVIPVADSGNIYPTNKYYQYGSKTLTYTSGGNTATSIAAGSAGAFSNSANLGFTLSSGTGVTQDDPSGKVYKGYSQLKFDFKGTFVVTSPTYGPAYGYLAFTPAVNVGSGGSAKIILDVSWLDKNGADLRDPVGTTLFYSSSSSTPYSNSQKLDGGVTFAMNDKFIVKGSIKFQVLDPCGPTTIAPSDFEFSTTPPIWKFNPQQGSSTLDFGSAGNWINVMGAANEPSPTPNTVGSRAQFVGTGTLGAQVFITQPTTVGMLDIDQPGVNIQSLGPALTFNTFGSDAVLTTRAQHDTSSLAHTIGAPIVLNKSLEAINDAAGALVLGGPVSGSGGITKSGAGVMVLSNISNSYSGNTTINQGALVVNGAIPAANIVTVNGGGVLSGNGNGTTTGRVGIVTLSGGAIHPGASPNDGFVGALTAAGLNMANGDLRMDIANIGSNDLINVQGPALISGPTTITPVFNPQTITPGTYVLLNAAALNIVPGAVPALSGVPTTSRLTFTLNAGPNSLSLVVAGARPKGMRWVGNAGTNWDLNTTTNWLDAGNVPQNYFDLDTLAFDDTAVNPNLFLSIAASPNAITFNNNFLNYTVFGNAASQITGSTGLTKTGSGKLILGVASTYTGVTAVQNGVLQLASPFALSPNSTLSLGSGGTSGMLDLNGNNATVGGLITSGGSSNIITNSAPAFATLTYAGQTGASTFGGTIQDGVAPVALHVATGMLTLTGANTYSGTTTIDLAAPTDASDGVATLQVGNGGTSGNLGTGPVVNNGALVFNRSDSYVVSNNISGSGQLYKIGTGTLTLNGINSASGGIFVKGGALVASNDASLGQLPSAMTDPSPVTLDGGTLVISGAFASQRPIYLGMSGGALDTGSAGAHFGDIAGCGDLTKTGAGVLATDFVAVHSLTINGGKITIPIERDNFGKVSQVDAISIANGKTLDLGGNDLILDYDHGGVPDPAKTTQIRNLIGTGFNGGDWMGSGITSARAAQSSTQFFTALGYGEASTAGRATFDGKATDGDMILVRFTVAGDANLDGVVNGLDFNALASSFGQPNSDWLHGDFDYNNVTDSTDFFFLAFDFNQSLLDPPPPAPGLGSLIPEPASALLLALPLLMRGRSRRGCS